MEKHPSKIVLKPLLTEKGTHLKDTGGRTTAQVEEGGEVRRKLLFEVASDANKISIRRAVERLFGVKVADVHTQIVRGKEKRRGRMVGRTPNWKKAIVTLHEGEKIEFFEGV
jgi:large subunit ribosomal protein L23